VADSGNHRVQAFDPLGGFLYKFNTNLNDPGRPVDPTDIAIDDSKNRCYVVDNDNHRILLYTKDGSRLLQKWGTRGEKPGEFQFPFLAALDKTSTLYVVDVLNTRVQAINEEGRTMAYIGKWGVDRGQFYRPKGVTVDKNNRIYVSDSYLGVIQVFQRYKNFIGVLGDESGKMLRFKTPSGIYVDNSLKLYVVEMLENRVAVYQILK
jgi:DNA-binding beta-propeller fold protein YncE